MGDIKKDVNSGESIYLRYKPGDRFTKYLYYIPPINQKNASLVFPLFTCLFATHTGYYERAYGHEAPTQTLSCSQMIYCTKGRGEVTIENRQYPVEAGDFFIISANVQHSYKASLDDPWTIYWILYDGQSVDDIYEKTALPINQKIHIGMNPVIIGLFTDVFDNFERMHNDFHLLLHMSATIGLILSHLARDAQQMGAGNLLVDRALSLMQENLNKPLSLDDFAEALKVSKSHLSHVYKTVTGYPLMSMYLRMRVNKACAMLMQSNMPISRIGEELGFESPYYFSHAFSRIMGCPPKKWRQQNCPACAPEEDE